ncbi:hypothetical protein [Curtobacterium sp. MCBA15_004]|uniref:hypothetical protein n=1 Tax=Curtobacterium sp. MCBA15_004 TaxID=1898733 RepID=UPI0008DD82C7|nr:hypothetical protein [Curtobacterium sp. MCBA15_004]WIA97644.1 hypothetical protein QOL16_04415 [Curtobacterium sp. MCBA15_004]
MGIRRSSLSFEGRYVQVPNDWARDERLSRRAKGMLVELMSHRVGWHITIAALQRTGPEGRDAIRTVVNELAALGYLRRVQGRGDGGRFNEVEYELSEPLPADGKSDIGGFAVVGSSDDGSPVVGESDTKEDHQSEDHLEEDDPEEDLLLAPSETSPRESLSAAFERFYTIFPRKVGRLKAEAAFGKAVANGMPVHVLIEAARRFATDPNLPADKQFIVHPATWLNQGRWGDEPLPPRAQSNHKQPAYVGNLDVVRQFEEEERHEQERGIEAAHGRFGN